VLKCNQKTTYLNIFSKGTYACADLFPAGEKAASSLFVVLSNIFLLSAKHHEIEERL
jgi:hypothetical protein